MKRSEIGNLALYDTKVAEAKQHFRVWPSPAASAWVVHQYKKAGGTFRTPKPIRSVRSVMSSFQAGEFWPSRAEVHEPVRPEPRTQSLRQHRRKSRVL